MALTFTIAGLQTELSAIETAKTAGNLASMWSEFADYCMVRQGLPHEVKGTLDEAKYPNPEQLKAALERWQEEYEASGGGSTRNNARFGRMRVSRRG